MKQFNSNDDKGLVNHVTFVQSAGGATIDRSELIDFLKERNYAASIANMETVNVEQLKDALR